MKDRSTGRRIGLYARVSCRDFLFRSIVFLGLIIFAGNFVVKNVEQATAQPSTTQSDKEGSHVQQPESFWKRLIGDPVAIFTFGIFILNGVLASATYHLAVSTKRLWLAGERQLDFLGQSIELARKSAVTTVITAERQLRPYVSFEFMEWRGLIDGRALGVRYNLIAHGQTPAHEVRVQGTIVILPFPLAANTVLPELKEAAPQSTVIFQNEQNGPNGWIVANNPFSAIEIAEVTSKFSERRVYLLGRITYRDLFSSELRETRFRRFVDPDSIERDVEGNIKTFRWAITEEGNSFT